MDWREISHTSNNQMNCLTASAVPWNHFFPDSPGVWVAANTYHDHRRRIRNTCRRYRGVSSIGLYIDHISAYLNKPITKVHTISQIIGSSNVAVKRLGIKLGEDVNFVNSTVDAIAHWNIYQSITPSNWYLKDHKKMKL